MNDDHLTRSLLQAIFARQVDLYARALALRSEMWRRIYGDVFVQAQEAELTVATSPSGPRRAA